MGSARGARHARWHRADLRAARPADRQAAARSRHDGCRALWHGDGVHRHAVRHQPDRPRCCWCCAPRPRCRCLLALHLGVVFALFITMPYGKFVHGLYRFAALVRYAQGASGFRRQVRTERMPSTVLDSDIFKDMFGTPEMRGGVLRRQSPEVLRRGRGRARDRAGQRGRHPAGSRRRDRAARADGRARS